MTRRLLQLLLCCATSLATTAHAITVVSIDSAPERERFPAWEALRIVPDANRRLEPRDVAKLAAGKDALSLDNPDRILGRGTHPYWAMLSLHNPRPLAELRILALETTTQARVELYARTGSDPWSKVRSMEDLSSGRFGSGTRYPVWTLQLPPRQTTEFLLRVEGPAIVRFPVFLYHPAQFAEAERRTHVAIGFTLGGCLFVIVFVGWRRRFLDDRSVPLFICMLMADLLGALWLTGTLDEFFPSISHETLSAIGIAAYALLFGCGILHARIYLNLSSWAPRLSLPLQLLASFWILIAPWFSLAFPVAARVSIVWGGTAMALMLVVVSFIATRRKIPLSGFIASAWLTYLFVGLYFLLARFVDTPWLWSPNTATLVQATVIAILFGLATNERLTQQRESMLAERQEVMRREQQHAALTRERSLLFAATNHDLRQPLLGIGLYADLLKSARSAAEREEHAQRLDLALKEVDDVAMSIQQLAAVYEGGERPAQVSAKLDDLLLPVIEEYRARSASKRVAIRYVPSNVRITTHVPYFQRIVRNVLSNAVRYTDRGDRILVGCRRWEGLRLVIANTGSGLSEEQLERAFVAFERFDSGRSIAEGFGLGLYSTKSLASALGLRVRLNSRRGKGTEFSIWLSADAPRSGHETSAVRT